MRYSVPIRLFTLLLGALIALHGHAQENVQDPAQEALELSSLETNWWSYFERPGDDTNLRVDAFLADVGVQVARMQAPNRPIGESILAAIGDNFSAYLELLKESTQDPKDLPPPSDSYTIADLMKVAAVSREARVVEVQAQLEVEREQRILDGISERRDLAFKRYVAAQPGDERLLTALSLVQTRTSQAIAAQRLQLLTVSSERATAYAEASEAHVEFARERLPITIDNAGLKILAAAVDTAVVAVQKAQDRLHAAEIAASRLAPDTLDGRLLQRLERQKLIEAQVVATLAELTSRQARLLLTWANLLLGLAPDFEGLEERSLATMELIRGAQESVPEWQRESESELLAVQTADRDGLSRASRRLLDQRLGTVQVTFNRISELQAVAADMQLLIVVTEKVFAENVGSFRSWLTISKRELIRIYNRITGLADVTLFSVGEAPVTGVDVLRVLIIMIIAFLLSRGFRFAIGRVGRSESTETQASLYTVGRLTHYATIIIALIIALSSIGIDFGNLALIAGALGVGIGFGLQSIVSNFVSGLIILFEHSLRVGDYIELDTGLTGTVKSINVRSTLINTNDNIDIVVPNSEFVTARLTNWTLGERILRVRIPFGVAYGSDKELVRKAAQEAAAKVQYTLTHMKGREPEVWLVGFGDSSLDFLLLVWVNRQGARRPTRTRAAYYWELESKLTEYGIEIPFPQRDLNLRTGWPGSQTEPVEMQESKGEQQDKSD